MWWNTSLYNDIFKQDCLSNLRPTTRECVHLVTYGQFRARDNDGVHSIWSAIAENPVLQANFKAPCIIEVEVLPIEVEIGNMDFPRFFPWPWLDDFHIRTVAHSLEMYWMSKNELPTSKLSKVIIWQTTGPKLYTTPLRGRSIMLHMMYMSRLLSI